MRFASLGSGSKGNATLVQTRDTTILVDCGFGRRDTEARLARLGVAADAIDAIFVTHEHGDHCAGVAALSKRYQLPVYLTHGTAASGRCDGAHQLVLFNAGDVITIADVEVQSVVVPHDAREPVQYRFDSTGVKLGILTDLGSITEHVVAMLSGCTALLLEFNHDLAMLQRGPYPPSLKRRVGGNYGHLNNQQAVDFLIRADTALLETLVVGHVSEQNNDLDLAAMAMNDVMASMTAQVFFADQAGGFDWLPVVAASEQPLEASWSNTA